MTYDPQRFDREVRSWQITGQEKRRTQYKVGPDPIFLDIGAYKGMWARAMYMKYGGTVYMFEVLPSHAAALSASSLGENPAYKIYNIGLGSSNKITQTSLENINDTFSVYDNNTNDSIDLKFVKMSDFIEDNRIEKVDVCKINIEGGEFDLLEHMLEYNICSICDNIQVQFHGRYPVPDFYNRWLNIREGLAKTHELTYDFYFVWENWKLKDLEEVKT